MKRDLRKRDDSKQNEETSDAVYEETAPNATVWQTYMREGSKIDIRMVGECRENLDVLLVFAGLFSAVVTTFIVQTYQSLQADYTQASAMLLFELVSIQRALANGTPLDTIPKSSSNPSTTSIPSRGSVWVNGLWLTSLVLSLSTALIAVLVKQWLHHYAALPSGTSRERSHTRQFRHAGFQKWQVFAIVGLLPVIMHAALAIFFLGLVIFLVPLQVSLSWTIGSITAFVYAAYMISVFLPIFFCQCPYRTPLSNVAYTLYHLSSSVFTFASLQKWSQKPVVALREAESAAVKAHSDELSVDALHWLLSASSDPNIQDMVIQSIGGLPMSSKPRVDQVFQDAGDIREAHMILLSSSLERTKGSKPLPGTEIKVERLLRFELFIPPLWCDMYTLRRNRRFIDTSNASIELAASIHVNPSFAVSVHKPSGLPSSMVFLEHVLSLEVKLPAIVWFNLVQNAKRSGAFDAVASTEHRYPFIICKNVITVFRYQRQPSVPSPSIAVHFTDAVENYFLGEMIDNLLQMFSVFDLFQEEPLSSHLRVVLACTEFFLQVALDDSEGVWVTDNVLETLESHADAGSLSVAENKAIFSTIVRILEGQPWSRLTVWSQFYVLQMYTAIVNQARIPPSFSGLKSLIAFMFDDHLSPTDHTKPFHHSLYSPFDLICNVLAHGLRTSTQQVYHAFRENQCLEMWGWNPFRSSMVKVVQGYIAGGMDEEAVEYLFRGENLFVACRILAVDGTGESCAGIITLARLRSKDSVWDTCRFGLRELMGEGKSDFFASQRTRRLDNGPYEALSFEDIEQQKNNVRAALTILHQNLAKNPI